MKNGDTHGSSSEDALDAAKSHVLYNMPGNGAVAKGSTMPYVQLRSVGYFFLQLCTVCCFFQTCSCLKLHFETYGFLPTGDGLPHLSSYNSRNRKNPIIIYAVCSSICLPCQTQVSEVSAVTRSELNSSAPI